jgi:hypothetical protein
MGSSIAAFPLRPPLKTPLPEKHREDKPGRLYLQLAQRYNRKEQQADVAQLVEQLIRNQQVVSSSLTVGSSFLRCNPPDNSGKRPCMAR